MERLKRFCRSGLRAALDALGPEATKRDAAQEAKIGRVEITISNNNAPGQVAREVARELVEMHRYRRSTPSREAFFDDLSRSTDDPDVLNRIEARRRAQDIAREWSAQGVRQNVVECLQRNGAAPPEAP